MKPKKTNIKIKHRKYNLYNRKKSKGKQALTVVLMIVIVLALAVIGYGAGKPIVEYFSSRGGESSDSTPSWTPPATAEASGDASSEETQTDNSSVPDDKTSEPEQQLAGMYILPENKVFDAASLKQAVISAKNAGYDGVVVTAKDKEGSFLYSSEISGIKGAEPVKGTLTAKEMCDIITAEGLVPAARFSTLLDRTSGGYVGGCYTLSDGSGKWLDAAPSNGGKKWMDPFSEECRTFMGSISEELSAAGFKYIIAADTMYPEFHPSDYSVYLYSLPIGDAEKRVEALWAVIDAVRAGAEKHGAAFAAEVDGAALLSDSRQSTDAELAGNAEKLSGITLLINYSGESSYSGAKAFIGRTGAQFPGLKYSVAADSEDVGDAVSDIRRAFNEAGTAVYVR